MTRTNQEPVSTTGQAGDWYLVIRSAAGHSWDKYYPTWEAARTAAAQWRADSYDPGEPQSVRRRDAARRQQAAADRKRPQ